MITGMRHRGTRTAQLLGALLLYVVALEAAIPTALMLERDAQTGRIAVVLCSAQVDGPVLFDPETGRVSDPEGSDQNADTGSTSCPFALAAMPVLPAKGGDLLAAVHPRQPARTVPAPRPVLTGHASPPLPPRGPPAFS